MTTTWRSRAAFAIALVAAVLGGAGARPAGAADGRPRAAVLEHRDARTGLIGLARQLRDAGFEVESLPVDRPPDALAGIDLIAFGSFVAEQPVYGRYVRRYREEIARFVERGGVVLQMTQDHEDEPEPPFLPDGLRAVRSDQDFLHLQANPEQPEPSPFDGLMLPHPNGRFVPLPGHPQIAASWEAFVEQDGFRVLLWSDEQEPYAFPAFLEGRHGRGRYLLTSLYLDRVVDRRGDSPAKESWRFASARFFDNLRRYVEAARAGTLAEFAPSAVEPPPALPWEPGSWTLVMLPDTQMYAQDDPAAFVAQTRWIVEHRVERDIRFVVHVGDVVNRGERRQWEVARRALRELDGVVPWSVTSGNHDYDPGTRIEDRETMLREYFPVERFSATPGWGGTFEPGRIENHWTTFEAGGRGWLVLALEWMPRDGVLAWADGVLAAHPDRSAIVVTHGYLRVDDARIAMGAHKKDTPWQHLGPPYSNGDNDGEDVWEKLLRRHANVAFVLCGHVTGDGAGRLTSRGDGGNVVHQILANYQQRYRGGQGYLRLLEFLPDGAAVQVRTYSPVLDRFMTWPDQQFVLPLPPPPPG